MPSIAETTLSSPLTDHLYSPFLLSILQQPLPDKPSGTYRGGKNKNRLSLAEKLGRGFLAMEGTKEILVDLVPHTARLTGEALALVPPGLSQQDAHDALSPSVQSIQDIQKSLQEGLILPGGHHQPLPPLPPPVADPLDNDCVLTSYLTAAYWDHIVSVTTRKCRYSNWVRGPGYYTNRQVTVVQIGIRWVIFSHDALLMVKDASMSHWLLHLYFHSTSGKANLCSHLLEFTRWGVNLLQIMGEEGYETIKGLEGLVKLRLIQLSEEILDPTPQIVNMIRKYRSKARSWYKAAILKKEEGIDSLWRLVRSISNPDELGEVFSFLKLLGHPYIDPVRGCESSKTLAQANRTISPSAVKQLEWSFCHTYTRGYIRKKARWPPLIFNLPEGKRSKLQELHDSNHPSLPLGLGLYDASDWDYATFAPHLEFDYGKDILSLISDTAISYKRTEIDNSWKGRLPFTPVKATTSTRVLEELLSRTSLDMRAICNRISARDIPFDWRIVTVCPKEREMKLEPRTFSMMVLEMRSFFVLTEQNLAEGIFSYIPEQSMTDSKTQLLQRFLKLTGTGDNTKKKTLMIELDFSRWNLKFEQRTMNPLGRRFDQIFGTDRLYDVVHEFYETCMVVLRHSSFTPKLTKRTGGHIPDQPGIWNGHPTGMEGIFQKGWTLATICIIQAAIWPLGLRYNIVGQGDNQVLFIECNRNPEESDPEFADRVRELYKSVSRSCSEFAAAVGHELKPEECTAGTSFTSYGKELWYKGRVLETTCKSVARMFPSTTSDVPSMFQVFSKISATGSATTDRSGYTLPLFFFTKLVENWLIRREFRVSYLHGDSLHDSSGKILGDLDTRQWDILLTLVPSNLGGLPVGTLAEYLYRGHQDPLASSLCSLRAFRTLPVVSAYLEVLERGLTLEVDSKVDREGLILDPYSIPIRRIAPATSRMASRMKGPLLRVTRNSDIKSLLIYNDRSRSSFMEDLLSSKPLYPKIVHDVYKSSLFGTCDTFSKRFTNTSTLYKIARRAEDEDLTTRCLMYDREYMRQTYDNLALVYKIRAPSLHKFDRPLQMYKLSLKLRERWGVGTMEGVTNIHPLDLGKILVLPYDVDSALAAERKESPIVSVMCLQGDTTSSRNNRGPTNPYIGSLTSEKSVAKWVRPVDSSPPQKDAIKLLQIRKLLTTPGSWCHTFLTTIAQSRCQYDVEELDIFTKEQVGGTEAHRYSTSDAPMGSYISSTSTWASHLSVSSNHSRGLGTIDRPVSYQEIYLTLSTLSCWYLAPLEINSPFGCILTIPDIECVPIVRDHLVDLDRPMTTILRPSPRLFYSTSEEIRVSSRYPKSARNFPTLLSSLPTCHLYLRESIASIFLDVLTGRMRRIRTGTYVRSEVRSSRVIDLPECTIIPYSDYLLGLRDACILHMSGRFIRSLHKDLVVRNHFVSLVAESALLLVPSVLSTIQECQDIPMDFGRPVIGGRSRETCIKWWVLQVINAACALGVQPSQPLPGVFTMGLSSLSSTLVSVLSYWIACSLYKRHGTKDILSAKILLRAFTSLTRPEEEYQSVEHILTFIHQSKLTNDFRVEDTSPQKKIRGYRSSVIPSIEYCRPPPVSVHTAMGGSCISCLGTDAQQMYELSYPSYALTDTLHSYQLRLWMDLSDAHLRWGPIWGLTPKQGNVLIIGIGAGGILRVVREDAHVIGVDLAVELESLGQESISYIPPVGHPHFSLHPVSWMVGGDITNPGVLERLLDECVEGLYDLVLLDVEGVDTRTRLRIRQQFAATGIPAYARIAGSPTDMLNAEASYCAFHEQTDRIWAPSIGLSQELVMGGGSSPMGLFKAVTSGPSHRTVEYTGDTALSDSEKELRVRLAYWSLSGEITTDLDRITGWIRNTQEWPTTIKTELEKLKDCLELGTESDIHLPKHLVRSFVLLSSLTTYRDT